MCIWICNITCNNKKGNWSFKWILTFCTFVFNIEYGSEWNVQKRFNWVSRRHLELNRSRLSHIRNITFNIYFCVITWNFQWPNFREPIVLLNETIDCNHTHPQPFSHHEINAGFRRILMAGPYYHSEFKWHLFIHCSTHNILFIVRLYLYDFIQQRLLNLTTLGFKWTIDRQ